MNMKVNRLAVAVGISFTLLASAPSYALLITNSITTNSSVAINGITDSANQNSPTYSFSEAGLWLESPVRAQGSAASYGYASGETGLKATGSNYTDRNSLATNLNLVSKAQVKHTAVITNDTESGQTIDFNFLILSGEISLGYSSTYGDGSTLIQSGYGADILVNGVSLWNSSASLTAVNEWWVAGHNLSLGGTNLGTSNGGLSYSWDSYAGSLNLGYLAAGSSLTLEYNINTYVNEYLATAGYAHNVDARFDDPWAFSTKDIFDASNFVTSDSGTPIEVPEPAGVLLVGAGLAGLAFRRKARKAKA